MYLSYPFPPKYCFCASRDAPTLTFSSEFFIQSSYSQGFIWNGIVASDKNFTDLTNTNTIFFNSVLLIGLKLQIEISSNSLFL